ncbi:AtpZ/AtpI family protein [Tepidimicrobium xylanilyticum]|uniref:F0F1-ATPase subunit, putative n=1 Tax=Tepidimicrobium xylanilyticum TaxID=1123352 RepID=A0A1H2R075_9FIRM|nr:AtpZ/AtpI family protein [Tepidimicrobium xylanilyticum]SDW12771.1 F0F1-ATPase subunit, putative [Tepidimicrobium xylanilyticum]
MNRKSDKNVIQYLSLITQIGLSVITPIILGVYLGGFVDRIFHTEMVFTLVFIILGAGTGFLNLFKLTGKHKNNGK